MGDISIIVKSAIDKVVISGGATALYWWCWSHQTHIDEIKHEPPNNILTSGWPWTRITVVDIPGFHLEPSCRCHVALMIGIALLESSSNLPITQWYPISADRTKMHRKIRSQHVERPFQSFFETQCRPKSVLCLAPLALVGALTTLGTFCLVTHTLWSSSLNCWKISSSLILSLLCFELLKFSKTQDGSLSN